MKHPIYDSHSFIFDVIKVMDNSDKLNALMFKIANILGLTRLPQNEISTIMTAATVFKKVIDNGHTLIKINNTDSEWKSDITEKTLTSLKLSDIKFSFKAATIVTGDYTISYSYNTKEELVNDAKKAPDFFKIVNPDVNTLTVYFTNKKSKAVWWMEILENDFLIRDVFDNETKEALTLLLSMLLYAEVFKADKTRVVNKIIQGKKSSSKNVPKHNINIVNLFQVVSNQKSLCGTANNRSASDKRWIVRGHWRNQFYKTTNDFKLIWIDPFWKGSGKEIVEKIYVIK